MKVIEIFKCTCSKAGTQVSFWILKILFLHVKDAFLFLKATLASQEQTSIADQVKDLAERLHDLAENSVEITSTFIIDNGQKVTLCDNMISPCQETDLTNFSITSDYFEQFTISPKIADLRGEPAVIAFNWHDGRCWLIIQSPSPESPAASTRKSHPKILTLTGVMPVVNRRLGVFTVFLKGKNHDRPV